MELLNPHSITFDYQELSRIRDKMNSIYRLITFSKQHCVEDILSHFSSEFQELKEQLSYKNARYSSSDNFIELHFRLQSCLHYISSEIKHQHEFNSEIQIIQLHKIIEPSLHKEGSSPFRNTDDKCAIFSPPPPHLVESLMTELLKTLQSIENPIVKAFYLHHELIRIKPFKDGNSRIARLCKNWILMYHLYPPIFILNHDTYIHTRSMSFAGVERTKGQAVQATQNFFKQELQRLENSISRLYKAVFETPLTNELLSRAN